MMSQANRHAYLMVLSIIHLAAIASCLSIERDDGSEADNFNFQPSGLFDYDSYKSLYGKQYPTEIEDSTRRCYFYARAMAVFVSGVKYKFRLRDHYNALNEMSDWSPEERSRTENKRIHQMITRSMARKSKELLPFLPAEGEQPELTLRKFLELKKSSDSRYQDLLNELYQIQPAKAQSSSSDRPRNRVKRDVGSTKPPRNFSFSKLINHDTEPELVAKPVRIKTNNPNYEFLDIMSSGLRDQIEYVEFISKEDREENERELGSLKTQLESKLGLLSSKDSNSDGSDEDLEDAIFVDHRNSRCMSGIRRQGMCGSCYAFAAMTIIEWIYCTKKGLLVEFSEQYMVDCGRDNIEGLYGCNGGTVSGVYDFVHNFGVELRSKYPYIFANGTCPYNSETDLKTTGYIRMELEAFVDVPMDKWAEALEREPLLINIQLVEDFYEYGGGVYDGAQCSEDQEKVDELHTVVVVGHGREDGKEFWLIRNSHGVHWGERGYYKLAKSAYNCIYDQTAYAMTWNYGQEVPVRPRRNLLHDDKILVSKGLKDTRKRRGNKRRKSRSNI